MSSTIAVVGAGPGLGRAIARRFGSAGHPVALVSRSQDKLEAIAASLRGEGITASVFPADVGRAWADRHAVGGGRRAWADRRDVL